MRKAVDDYLDLEFKLGYTCYTFAGVAELADAHDSKSCSLGNVGSIPTFGIKKEAEKISASFALMPL